MGELGPYEVIGVGGIHMDGTRDGYAVVDANGQRRHHLYLTRDEARLFAAAPDLLAACESALKAFENLLLTERIDYVVERRGLKAAIAKAKGEQA